MSLCDSADPPRRRRKEARPQELTAAALELFTERGFAATRLEEIEMDGDAALVRKKFDGHLAKSDGSFDRMNWQTLYICRREGGRWKIAGFVGYLPHMPQ